MCWPLCFTWWSHFPVVWAAVRPFLPSQGRSVNCFVTSAHSQQDMNGPVSRDKRFALGWLLITSEAFMVCFIYTLLFIKSGQKLAQKRSDRTADWSHTELSEQRKVWSENTHSSRPRGMRSSPRAVRNGRGGDWTRHSSWLSYSELPSNTNRRVTSFRCLIRRLRSSHPSPPWATSPCYASSRLL